MYLIYVLNVFRSRTRSKRDRVLDITCSEDAAEFQSISAVKRVKNAVGSTASAHKNSENSYLEALSLHCSSIIQKDAGRKSIFIVK